jgi:hypothetical protein
MLTWQKASSPDALNWDDAKKYCASVGGGGFTFFNSHSLNWIVNQSAR